MIQQQKDGRPLMLEAQRIVAKYGPTGLYRGLVRCDTHFNSVAIGMMFRLCNCTILHSALQRQDAWLHCVDARAMLQCKLSQREVVLL